MGKVSIIIATYNVSGVLCQSVDSILSQIYSDIELIIVDGCSTDNTVDIVKGYNNPKIRYIVEKDKGIYDAMNKGVSLATGQWLLFMGADDRLYDKNTIQDMIGHENLDNSYDVIIGNIKFDNNKVRRSSVSNRMKFINTVHHQSVFYKRELFRTFKYNDTYKVSADYELNLLLYLKRVKVLMVDRLVCIVTLGGVSGKVDFCGYAEEIKIRNKYLKNSPTRMFMNCVTCLRYMLKKMMMLIGHNVHFYN